MGDNTTKRSAIWNHFIVNSAGFAKCDICNNTYSFKGGSTSNLKKHLETQHNIFLQKESKPCTVRGRITVEGSVSDNIVDEDNELIYDSETVEIQNQILKTPQTTCRKYKRQKIDNSMGHFLKTRTNALSSFHDKPDEYEALGINYGAKIKKMTTNQQIYAELLIQQVITRGLLGQLGENIHLVNIQSQDRQSVMLPAALSSPESTLSTSLLCPTIDTECVEVVVSQ